jgi:AcrR family transcriptional regulator
VLDERGSTTYRSAARGQARLIAAAARVFHDAGLDASVTAIAADAGVSVATVRRHFPAQDDLVTAVLGLAREQLAVACEHALSAGRDGQVLTAFVKENTRLVAQQRAFTAALARPDIAADVSAQLGPSSVAILAPVVDHAHRTGELRREIDVDDVLVALRTIALTVTAPEIAPDRAERFVETVLRGMRSESAAPTRLRLPWAS